MTPDLPARIRTLAAEWFGAELVGLQIDDPLTDIADEMEIAEFLAHLGDELGTPIDRQAVGPRAVLTDIARAIEAAQPAPDQPTIWFVAPDGSDRNDGRSRATAFATLGHAIGQACGAATVIVDAGPSAPAGRVFP